jgi:MSHA pilin protein MshC
MLLALAFNTGLNRQASVVAAPVRTMMSRCKRPPGAFEYPYTNPVAASPYFQTMGIGKFFDILHHRHATVGAVQRGFTLIELIMVMVMLGVLAAVAGPKILNVSIFNARGFHDQTVGYLRYAQKAAVAQRHTVCVAFTTSSITLTMAAATGTTSCPVGALAGLVGPLGESPVVLNAKAGVAYTSLPTAFNFDALGQPISATGAAQSTQTIQVGGASERIIVETGTGYVHE